METKASKDRGSARIKFKDASFQAQNRQPLNVPVSLQQLIVAIKKMKKREREAFLEDLLAATSPSYLASIREAREDYRRGRVSSHEEIFGHHS